MALALFDLDNTLLDGDSDHSWGLFLAEIGVISAQEYKDQQNHFYRQYLRGSLNIQEFLAYQLKPLRQYSMEQLLSWRTQFMVDIITPMIESGKPELLKPHQEAGDEIIIITATNDFIASPIAEQLGVSILIATTAELINGQYTGKCAGTPCFQEGKVEKLQSWLVEQGRANDIALDSFFYSDSFNDLPLLEKVSTPIAVSPDEKLQSHAQNMGWTIIN